jgi:hypothetical protein
MTRKTTLSFDAQDVDLILEILQSAFDCGDVTNDDDMRTLLYNLTRFRDAESRLKRRAAA